MITECPRWGTPGAEVLERPICRTGRSRPVSQIPVATCRAVVLVASESVNVEPVEADPPDRLPGRSKPYGETLHVAMVFRSQAVAERPREQQR